MKNNDNNNEMKNEMKKNIRTRGYSTTAYTEKDFAADTIGGKYIHKAGTAVDARALTENGFWIVEGHGMGYNIPLNAFTKFDATWKEVETKEINGERVEVVTNKEIDVTTEWLNHFNKIKTTREEKRKEKEEKEKRIRLRDRIKKLREMLRLVKTGLAEKELNENLDELETLKK